MKLTILDWYIIKKFLGTFFYSISLILLIVIVFDLSEKIDNFIERGASVQDVIFVYYLNFIPFFINLFSPLFTFIAVIYFTSRLAFNTEIIAILSAGVSFRRLLVPYFISAIFLTIILAYLANVLIPEANRKRLDFEEVYVRGQTHFREQNIHLQLQPGAFVYLESFNERLNLGQKFALETITEGSLNYRLLAQRAEWIDSIRTWRLHDYHIRTFNGIEETIVRGNMMDTVLQFSPSDFIQNRREIVTLNFRELRDFIDSERLRGAEGIRFYLVEKHRRIAFPFATLVLTIIGVSLSSRKVRGGIGLHLGLGILLSFSFILFMQVSSTFATNGNLSPFIAVWIPNFLYMILGVYLLKIAPK